MSLFHPRPADLPPAAPLTTRPRLACTVVTDVITGRPARFIRNALIDDLVASGLKPLPFPAQLGVTAPLAESGDGQLTALFSGQSAALTRETTAGELVRTLAQATTQRLRAVTSPT